MNRSNIKIQLSLLVSALCLPMAHGAYTYIDATPFNPTTDPLGNTTVNGAAMVDGTNYFKESGAGNGTTGDGFWGLRDGSSFTTFNGGTAFETDAGSSAGDRELTDPLITTINLAVVGTYDIVAIFTQTNTRDIAAKIGSAPGAGDVFTAASPFTLNPNQDATSDPLFIAFDGSFSNGRTSNAGAAYLGQFTTTVPNEAVSIYIDGLAGTAGTQDERTQYDGVGYQLVPEPGSAMLGLLGACLLLRRRR